MSTTETRLTRTDITARRSGDTVTLIVKATGDAFATVCRTVERVGERRYRATYVVRDTTGHEVGRRPSQKLGIQLAIDARNWGAIR